MQLNSSIPVDVPIVMRVENTLVRTNPALETLVRYITTRPLGVVVVICGLVRGWPLAAHEMALRSAPDPKRLPFDRSVLAIIDAHKSDIYLISSSDEALIRSVANYVGATGFLASDASRTVGSAQIQDFIHSIGLERFTFIGHDGCDLMLWNEADVGVVVRPKRGLLRKLYGLSLPLVVISRDQSRARHWARFFGLLRSLRGAFALLPPMVVATACSSMQISDFLAPAVSTLCILFATGTMRVGKIESDRRDPMRGYSALAIGAIELQTVLFALWMNLTLLIVLLWTAGSLLAVSMCLLIFASLAVIDRPSKPRFSRVLKGLGLDLMITLIGLSVTTLPGPREAVTLALGCVVSVSLLRWASRVAFRRIFS